MIRAAEAALQGIRSGMDRMAGAAKNIASMSDQEPEADPVRDIVEIKNAEISIKANLEVLKAADEAQKSVIDIYA